MTGVRLDFTSPIEEKLRRSANTPAREPAAPAHRQLPLPSMLV